MEEHARVIFQTMQKDYLQDLQGHRAACLLESCELQMKSKEIIVQFSRFKSRPDRQLDLQREWDSTDLSENLIDRLKDDNSISNHDNYSVLWVK
jgi:hypothetical protein